MSAFQWPFISGRIASLVAHPAIFSVRGNAYRCALGKIGRLKYTRQYPVTVLNADGSTIQIRTAEPRYLIELPIDLNLLSESERRKRLASRKKKVAQIKEDAVEDNFNPTEYFDFLNQSSESDASNSKK